MGSWNVLDHLTTRLRRCSFNCRRIQLHDFSLMKIHARHPTTNCFIGILWKIVLKIKWEWICTERINRLLGFKFWPFRKIRRCHSNQDKEAIFFWFLPLWRRKWRQNNYSQWLKKNVMNNESITTWRRLSVFDDY